MTSNKWARGMWVVPHNPHRIDRAMVAVISHDVALGVNGSAAGMVSAYKNRSIMMTMMMVVPMMALGICGGCSHDHGNRSNQTGDDFIFHIVSLF